VIIPAFELHRPTTLDEALGLATKFAPEMDFIAGGTDLIGLMKDKAALPARV